jgi:competence protein ComEC
MFYKPPDILVSREFSLMGYRSEDGALHISGRKSDRFSIENWERMMGLPERAAFTWPREGREGDMICDHAACRLELKARRISFLKTVEALSTECAWAEIVITRNVVDKNVAQNICPRTQVLDKFDGLRGGAHAIWLEPEGERIQTAEQGRGLRPWSGLNKIFRPWLSDSFASGRQGGPEF